MEERHQLLVVAPTVAVADALISQLGGHHTVTLVTSFEAAKAQLAKRPHLLITELKLGEYNGLQLALRLQYEHTPAIVIGNQERGWEREARQLGVMYVDRVPGNGGMRTLVRNLLSAESRNAEAPSPIM